ncbi:MAG TPA: radical SAM protein, partial [Terriglobales bacterium]|nr:radical SAM protein [Terriglobales bacterium]
MESPRMRDSFGRVISDLRISVTDRCNYRCVYCRVGRGEEMGAAAGNDALSWTALERLARVLVGLGIRKVRLTGGEPLLRRGLAAYISFLRELGVGDIALTTNGHLLGPMAAELRRAGLSRVTISLDSLQPEKFARITRVPDGLPRVLAALDAAAAAGLAPVKVNVVLLRGVNDDEVEALAGFARERAATVRFIEFMPLEQGHLWTPAMVVPMREIVER